MITCRHRIEIDKQIFCTKKREFITQPYKCSKHECSDCHFPTVAVISMNIGRCDECPFHYTKRTPCASYAFDYFCKAMDNKKITSYVEYDNEIPPVPMWCPFRLEERE